MGGLPIGDPPANARSDNINRYVPNEPRLHSSITKRVELKFAPIRKRVSGESKIFWEKYNGYKNWKADKPICSQ